MTREEARKAAEAMLAYADGKKIEDYSKALNKWVEANGPIFNWVSDNYRIKPEPTYRPFKNKEECWEEMQKHQPFGWIKEIKGGAYRQITSITNNNIPFDDEFLTYTFADGTPFGIKED